MYLHTASAWVMVSPTLSGVRGFEQLRIARRGRPALGPAGPAARNTYCSHVAVCLCRSLRRCSRTPAAVHLDKSVFEGRVLDIAYPVLSSRGAGRCGHALLMSKSLLT
jgi:hypothetical protein